MSTDIVNVTNHSKNTILIGKYVNNHNNDRKNIKILYQEYSKIMTIVNI